MKKLTTKKVAWILLAIGAFFGILYIIHGPTISLGQVISLKTGSSSLYFIALGIILFLIMKHSPLPQNRRGR